MLTASLVDEGPAGSLAPSGGHIDALLTAPAAACADWLCRIAFQMTLTTSHAGGEGRGARVGLWILIIHAECGQATNSLEVLRRFFWAHGGVPENVRTLRLHSLLTRA